VGRRLTQDLEHAFRQNRRVGLGQARRPDVGDRCVLQRSCAEVGAQVRQGEAGHQREGSAGGYDGLQGEEVGAAVGVLYGGLNACRAAGVQPTVEDSYRCTDFLALQAIVATGRALSLVPRLALPYLRSDLCARPLEHAPVAHVRAARLAEADPSVLSEGMLEILREATAHLRGSPVAAVDLCASPST